MLLGTTLDISYDEKPFLMIVACNLFHKAAFMNFMFLKHCRINLLELNCEKTFVITLDIHFLGKAFILITGCDLSRKPVIMGFNVPVNLLSWQTCYHGFQRSHEPVLKLSSDLSLKLY